MSSGDDRSWCRFLGLNVYSVRILSCIMDPADSLDRDIMQLLTAQRRPTLKQQPSTTSSSSAPSPPSAPAGADLGSPDSPLDLYAQIPEPPLNKRARLDADDQDSPQVSESSSSGPESHEHLRLDMNDGIARNTQDDAIFADRVELTIENVCNLESIISDASRHATPCLHWSFSRASVQFQSTGL